MLEEVVSSSSSSSSGKTKECKWKGKRGGGGVVGVVVGGLGVGLVVVQAGQQAAFVQACGKEEEQ